MLKRILGRFFLILVILVLFLVFYFFVGTTKPAAEITWGVNFSQKHATNLGLDWRQTYWAILDDLKVRNLKIAVAWDLIEPEQDKFNFSDLDWQVKTAEEKGAKIFLVIGMKTPRWPECHLPGWAMSLTKREQQKEILKMIEAVVLRYRDSEAIWAWQVENEFLFPFGLCPWTDKDFLKKEIALVRLLDKSRPIIITDTGEFSLWLKPAYLGDIVGVTIYRKAWFHQLGIYVRYPIPAIFYSRKANLIKYLFGKKVICVELQAEPWGPVLLYDLPLEEQEKTMNLAEFKKHIEYAQQSGLDTFYLWGAEWWYWLKEKHYQPEIWEEAKKLF